MAGKLQLPDWISLTDKRLAAIVEKMKAYEARASLDQSQLDTLAYHVDAYESVVQGTAIRPERAVPAIVRDPRTGTLFVNRVKSHVKPYVFPTNPTSIVVPANGTTIASFVIRPEENLEGMTEIFMLMLASATSMSCRVKIRHVGIDKYLMNQPVWIGAVFSDQRPAVTTQNETGNQPKFLRESIFLEPNQELQMEFTDFSGSQNTLEVFAHGRRFFPDGIVGMTQEGVIQTFLTRPTFPYWLTQDQAINLATGSAGIATGPITFTVDRAFGFEAMESHKYTAVNGVQTNVAFHATLREGMNSRVLFDAIDSTCMAGNGNFPMPWIEPYLLERGAPMSGTFTNDGNTSSATIDLVLHGRAIPVTLPGQRTLVPLSPGQGMGDPRLPSQHDLNIPRAYST